MIIYGLTLQGKDFVAPKELADWVTERQKSYPKIDFQIDCVDTQDPEATKYSRIYANVNFRGVQQVGFPFKSQVWWVRIIGGLNKQGEIHDPADKSDEFSTSLPGKLRDEIAQIPDRATLAKLNEKTYATMSTTNNVEEPIFVPLSPDIYMSSEVSMSGAELEELLSDSATKDEATRAIWEKDWSTLKRLQKGKS